MNRALAILVFPLAVLVFASAQQKSATVEAYNHVREQVYRRGGDGWSITIKYPSIASLPKFNAAVIRQVHATAAKFLKEFPGSPSEQFSNYSSYLNGVCTARVLRNGIISVLCDYGEYVAGAAHPWEVVTSVNYDSRTSRVLKLADLFNPGADYVSRLSKLSSELLMQRPEIPDEQSIRNGAGPVEQNFQVFTLTDDALIVHFQQYQVAPGVAPALQIEIPLTKLHPLLRTRYRADRDHGVVQ